MPQVIKDQNSRVSLRVRADRKALLRRAASIRQCSLTDFVVETAIRAAEETIEQAERVVLSERDSLLVMAALENPPAPNEKLRRAAQALPPT